MLNTSYYSGDTDDVSQHWTILTLDPLARTISSQEVDGPANPDGVCSIRLTRVGDVVVAYGGIVFSEQGDPKWLNGILAPKFHWFMALYSIATDEWETLPYTPGDPTELVSLFAIEDTLMGVSGTSHASTSVLTLTTWEWSLGTRAWTYHRQTHHNCHMCDFKNPASTQGDTHFIFSHNCTLRYKSGTWERTDHMWPVYPEADGTHYFVAIATPLYGRNQLLVTQVTSDDDEILLLSTDIWIQDMISQDVVLLRPLPLTDQESVDIPSAHTVMVNPTTLLILTKSATVLIDIDPRYLGPEYHTSMVGSSEWMKRAFTDSESVDVAMDSEGEREWESESDISME
ncbi:hypothetical protein KIPB_001101 [Kipferlia bialata]|uniref:Kelch-type beta propeller n=1 Tax=Kipferlia bialata TaxID=797122 RepID=A0A391NIH7_9EUKA|nr:hypothetical protein KIPB_001101 [Kipferlia bialata]|eukprot:g1101.t1